MAYDKVIGKYGWDSSYEIFQALTMRKISCIIPAYNEEERIGFILNTLTPLLSDILKEIIVVDDFSSDKTREMVKKFSHVILLEHRKNEGKSKTIADGIQKATGEYILMIDGDLIGLEGGNILDMVNPILNNQADITISYRGNTPKWWIRIFKIEMFSGERCFSRDFIMPYIDAISMLPSYGLEAFINEKIIDNNLRIKSVAMNNVTISFQWDKHGIFIGIWKEILMLKDISSVIGPKRFISQLLKTKRLLVD
jgi:glycosyltransferase involved in cell wall biosynthesis